MLEWSVGWFCPRDPPQTLPGCLGCLLLVVAFPLAGLACPAREALLLPISSSSCLILFPLNCMLVLQISWSFNLWLKLGLSVHESGENACPCIFSPTFALRKTIVIFRRSLVNTDSFCRRLINKFLRTSYFLRIFGVTEVFEISRLLQTILFLTYSVFSRVVCLFWCIYG